MLGKLIKYEFKATWKVMVAIYSFVMVIAVLENIRQRTDADYIQYRITEIRLEPYIIAFVSIIIGVTITLVRRFYVSMIKDRAYLTHTIPVSVNKLLISKTIVSMTWIGTAFIMCMMVMLVANLGIENCKFGRHDEAVVAIIVSVFVENIIRAMTIGAGLTMLGIVWKIYAFISIGHTFQKHKMLGPLSIVVVVEIAARLVKKILSEILLNFNSAVHANIIDAFTIKEGELEWCWLGIIYTIIVMAIYYLIVRYVFEKRINV